jgi:RNA polymerase sigma factor (sigma-70 family)
MSTATRNDAELVGESLSGNRDAFGQIVSRYQSLVCSLAYSATGSLSQSEDLAQETFVAAWRQLADLREPGKLRAWLCGIARNLIHNTLRRQGREPAHAAEQLDAAPELPSLEPSPTEQAISKEEEAILWRSLERIPEIYREPLVLFYREHQSIETVAQNLELTEDAVKQRLSRGRKMLHEQVLAFVEGALARTNPGEAFTLGVVAALPMGIASAKAATVGAALAKGGAAAKGVATMPSRRVNGNLCFVGCSGSDSS